MIMSAIFNANVLHVLVSEPYTTNPVAPIISNNLIDIIFLHANAKTINSVEIIPNISTI